MVLPPLISTVRFLRFLSVPGDKTMESINLMMVRGRLISWVKNQTHIEIHNMGKAKISCLHVWGRSAKRTALPIRSKKHGYHPMMSAKPENDSSSSLWFKTGLWLLESRQSDRMTNGSWMTVPTEAARLILLLLRVLSGDVEIGDREFGELGLWKPELLLVLPAWMLSLLGHTRDKLSEVQVGILNGRRTDTG
jgi:hypothetical protein